MDSQEISCFSVVAAFDLSTIEDPIKVKQIYSSFDKDSRSSFLLTHKVGIDGIVLDLLKFENKLNAAIRDINFI